MSKLKSFLVRIKEASAQASERALLASTQVKTHIVENKDEWRESALRHAREGQRVTETFAREGLKKGAEQAKSLYVSARYSKARLKELQNSVENQGAAYRELQRDRRVVDTLFLGGESMAMLLAGLTPLTLYQKAKSAGDRSAKAYFSYLIGGGIAAITNTWWLGVWEAFPAATSVTEL